MNSYGVNFIGGYYSLFTNVYADNEEQAERTALTQILEQYGWDLTGTYDELEITHEATLSNH